MKGGTGQTGPSEGRGAGLRDPGTPEDTKFKKETLHPRELNPGQIVGTLPVEGEAPKGEVRTPVRPETAEALQRMAEKVETEVLPAEYREQVLRYMELLRRPAGPGAGESKGEGGDAGGEPAGGEKGKPEEK